MTTQTLCILKKSNLKKALMLTLVLTSTGSWAQTRYITDQFEVTLRTGASTSNNIISMLGSGQAVTVLEDDEETKYTLVETRSGKQGYVLTRFLDAVASGRERFNNLQVISDKLKTRIETLKKELNDYRNMKQTDSGKISELQINLSRSEKELEKLKVDTRDTVRVIKQNDKLKARINDLEAEKQQLTEENTIYKDSTAMDWFVRGAAVSLAAFLLGIVVTRIRWKKRDSWGGGDF